MVKLKTKSNLYLNGFLILKYSVIFFQNDKVNATNKMK